MSELPWDTGNPSEADARLEFDESTPEQRIVAAQAISIRLLRMSDSLRGRSDIDAAAERDYADCLASRLNNCDPSIDDIWIAAELLRERDRRAQRAFPKPRSVSK